MIGISLPSSDDYEPRESQCAVNFPSFQGERILKLAEMCRKLETETEKVLPFYASSLGPQEDEDVAAAMQEAPSEPLAEVRIFSALQEFCHTVLVGFKVAMAV